MSLTVHGSGGLSSDGLARRKTRRVAATLAITVIAAAGVGAFGSSRSNASATVTVGNISSIAGLGGTFAGFQAGLIAFFDYYNAHGGINGTKVKLITYDDAADPGKNATYARTLVSQNNVLAMVGQATLADAASQKYLAAAGVPVVGGWAASSTWLPPTKNMFANLMGPNVPYCGLWPEDEAKAQGVTSMAFIAQAFPEAIQDANCRIAAARHAGITIAGGKQIDVSQTAVDFTPAVQQAIASGANAIMTSTTTDGTLKIIKAGVQLGFKGTYYTTQFAGVVKGLDQLGIEKAVSGRLFSSAFSLLSNDPSTYSAELAKYKAGIKQYEPSYAADVTSVSGWAAGKLFADALTAAGPSRSGILKWVSKQTAYNFGGLQGPVNYTLGSRPNPCTTRIAIKNNKIVRSPSAAKPPGFNCAVLINPATGKVNSPA